MFTWFYEACNFLGSPLAVFQGFGATSNFWRRSKYLTHFFWPKMALTSTNSSARPIQFDFKQTFHRHKCLHLLTENGHNHLLASACSWKRAGGKAGVVPTSVQGRLLMLISVMMLGGSSSFSWMEKTTRIQCDTMLSSIMLTRRTGTFTSFIFLMVCWKIQQTRKSRLLTSNVQKGARLPTLQPTLLQDTNLPPTRHPLRFSQQQPTATTT